MFHHQICQLVTLGEAEDVEDMLPEAGAIDRVRHHHHRRRRCPSLFIPLLSLSVHLSPVQQCVPPNLGQARLCRVEFLAEHLHRTQRHQLRWRRSRRWCPRRPFGQLQVAIGAGEVGRPGGVVVTGAVVGVQLTDIDHGQTIVLITEH